MPYGCAGYHRALGVLQGSLVAVPLLLWVFSVLASPCKTAQVNECAYATQAERLSL